MGYPRRLSCLSLLASLALAAPFAAAQSSAPSPARQAAGLHFRAGVAAYERADYSSALGEFQSAYRIAPHHAVRVNIANCYMHLGRPIDALGHFESFLSEAAAAGGVQPQQRREVTSQIADLRGQVAEFRVQVEPSSVRDPIVSVDGQMANAAGVLRMMPGRHTIEVTADGYAPGRQEVTATAAQRDSVTITLRSASAATPALVTVAVTTSPTVGPSTASAATTTSREPSPPGSTQTTGASVPSGGAATGGDGASGAGSQASSASEGGARPVGLILPTDTRRRLPPVAFIAAAAGTGAFAIGWGVFGGLALSANAQFNAIANRSPIDVAAGTAAANRARTFALVSDVMMGLTVAGAATSTILLLNTRWGGPRTVAMIPMITPGGAALAVGGVL
jgi:hypothetical protein